MNNDILQQQIAYYRARASEYDEWFYRRKRYDRGEEANQQWFDEAAAVRGALHALGSRWQTRSNSPAAQVFGRRNSPSLPITSRRWMLRKKCSRSTEAKLSAPNVSYQQADLFAWQPDQQYDLVFFSFWLSHVPPERLAPFLAMVNRALKPGGRLFMIDSTPDLGSSAKNSPSRSEDDGIYQKRNLNDGNLYTIVKIYYESD